MEAPPERQSLLRQEDVENTPVYPTVMLVRRDIIHFIDTPLTYGMAANNALRQLLNLSPAALTAPDLTYTLIHPLLEKYCNLQRAHNNLSVVFCLLLNRVHFIRDDNLGTAAVSQTRAMLCEILAIRVLRDHGNNMMDLVVLLTTSWPIYAGASPEVIAHGSAEFVDFDPDERVGNAIEVAIVGKSKRFLKSTSCQKVIDGIWAGRYVYQAESSHSILSDTYKRTPVHMYDPHKAPLLDHYRLKVPAIRSVLEYSNFLILFVLFVFAMEMCELERLNAPEVLFMVYALGFSLEKVAAMQEHGIKVYFKGTWVCILFSFKTDSTWYWWPPTGYMPFYDYTESTTSTFGHALSESTFWRSSPVCSSLGTLLAFVTLQNNLMVLSLRAMIVQFCLLMAIAAFCFAGFLYALATLSRNEAGYSVSQIAWWMLDLWFGLDASGFDRASQFHPTFGPILMVTYACMSNTLLLTVLVSILSNTFATISEDAEAEVRELLFGMWTLNLTAAQAMFRKAVSTIEGVKADSLFSYQPPINVLALCIMLPASYILTPRQRLHDKVRLLQPIGKRLKYEARRITSFPILLLITLYERQAKKNGTTTISETLSVITERVVETLPRRFKIFNFFEGLAGSDHDIDAVFEIEDEVMSSALALDESSANEDVSKAHDQRRLSPYSSPTRPTVTPPTPVPGAAHPSHPTPGPATPVSASPPPARPGPPPGPRARVASLMHRGTEVAQTFTSPLAQIFQPLIVDDGGIPEEVINNQHLQAPAMPQSPATSAGNGSAISSSSAAYRRRLSSMHVRNPSTAGVGHATGLHARRASEAPRMLFPTSEAEGVFSASPDEHSSMPTAEDVEEKKGEWIERLDKIEARQERIEEMLEQIIRKLG
ncbi:hypothetical protein HMN09_00705000 [Mycena chlorophos]|uniref:Receptor-activated Ca2+-permeable cation channel n=1 Tax=Mycena chlorophos TaxID=658473 RepID=A0A8H6WDM2_MYCCL|nr:hypothetical protein HMN09_00705000 [Mycena chlorophos]